MVPKMQKMHLLVLLGLLASCVGMLRKDVAAPPSPATIRHTKDTTGTFVVSIKGVSDGCPKDMSRGLQKQKLLLGGILRPVIKIAKSYLHSQKKDAEDAGEENAAASLTSLVSSLRKSGRNWFTWCQRADTGAIYFTTTETSKSKDFKSKHAVMCDSKNTCGAGEATISGGKLWLDNNSGTYKPSLDHIEFSAAALNRLGNGPRVQALNCFDKAKYATYCDVFATARAGGLPTPHARDIAKCDELQPAVPQEPKAARVKGL